MSESGSNTPNSPTTEGQTQNPAKKNGRGNQFFRKQNRTGPVFKGSVEKMNGHVFQTYGEQSKRGEFQRTLEELQIYCSTTYVQEAGLLEPLFSKLENPSLNKPTKPTYNEEESLDKDLEEDIYKEEIKAFVKTRSSLRSTLHSLFNVIWGQCSPLLKGKLESKDEYKDIKEKKDVAGLLKLVKTVVYQFESHTSIYEALDEAKKNYYHYYQGPRTSNTQHAKDLQDIIEVIEYHGGSVTDDQALVNYERDMEAHLPEDESSSEEVL